MFKRIEAIDLNNGRWNEFPNKRRRSWKPSGAILKIIKASRHQKVTLKGNGVYLQQSFLKKDVKILRIELISFMMPQS